MTLLPGNAPLSSPVAAPNEGCQHAHCWMVPVPAAQQQLHASLQIRKDQHGGRLSFQRGRGLRRCYDRQTLLLFIYMGEVIYGMHRGWQQMAQSTLITMHFIKNQNIRSYRITAHLFLIEKIIYLFCDCLAWQPCTVSWWESCDQQCVAPLDREGSVSNLSFEESGSGLLNSSDQKESTELGWGGTYHHWSSTLHPGWFSKAFLRCHQITSLDSSADLLHGLCRLYQWSRCSCQQNFHNTFFGWGFSCL